MGGLAALALLLWAVPAAAEGVSYMPKPGLPACDAASIAGRTPETPTRIVVGSNEQGPEMTVFYPKGRYVVSRCDDQGRLIEAQDVSLFEFSDGEKIHLPTTATEAIGEPGKWYRTFNAEHAVDQRTRRLVPSRGDSKANFHAKKKRSRVLAPTEEGKEVEPTPVSSLSPFGGRTKARASYWDSGCSNFSYGQRGEHWWNASFGYEANLGSFPDWGWLGVTGGPWVDNAMEMGINQWNFYSEDECNPNGSTSTHRVRRVFGIWRAGWTSLSWANNSDWHNVVDMGYLPWCGPSAWPLACTMRRTDWSNSTISEADIRFSDEWSWKPSSQYDWQAGYSFLLRAVAAHEFGHAIGLDHAGDNTQQTMQPALPNGDTQLKTLGAGDECGFFVIYYGAARCQTNYF